MTPAAVTPPKDPSPAELLLVTPDRVLQAYRGRPGCMCGCRGNYAYLPELQEAVAKDIGYEPDPKMAQPRAVKMRLEKVQAAVRAGHVVETGVDSKGIRNFCYDNDDGDDSIPDSQVTRYCIYVLPREGQ